MLLIGWHWSVTKGDEDQRRETGPDSKVTVIGLAVRQARAMYLGQVLPYVRSSPPLCKVDLLCSWLLSPLHSHPLAIILIQPWAPFLLQVTDNLSCQVSLPTNFSLPAQSSLQAARMNPEWWILLGLHHCFLSICMVDFQPQLCLESPGTLKKNTDNSSPLPTPHPPHTDSESWWWWWQVPSINRLSYAHLPLIHGSHVSGAENPWSTGSMASF